MKYFYSLQLNLSEETADIKICSVIYGYHLCIIGKSLSHYGARGFEIDILLLPL